jgi:hypothetical protein
MKHKILRWRTNYYHLVVERQENNLNNFLPFGAYFAKCILAKTMDEHPSGDAGCMH